MHTTEFLLDAFGRIHDLVHHTVDGLGAEQLSYRPDADANSIAWLVWHLTRIQDDHIAGPAGHQQIWTAQGWARRFDLPFEDAALGYGQSSAEVAAIAPQSAELLVDYHDAVYEQTRRFLAELTDDELDRVVDDSFDPPVTLAVRLVSVISDDLQHLGQAAYVRGLADRR